MTPNLLSLENLPLGSSLVSTVGPKGGSTHAEMAALKLHTYSKEPTAASSGDAWPVKTELAAP
eukprot:7989151-Karenia_brevis.AAC.1